MKPYVGQMLVFDKAVAVTDGYNMSAKLLQTFLYTNVDSNGRTFIPWSQYSETDL